MLEKEGVYGLGYTYTLATKHTDLELLTWGFGARQCHARKELEAQGLGFEEWLKDLEKEEIISMHLPK